MQVPWKLNKSRSQLCNIFSCVCAVCVLVYTDCWRIFERGRMIGPAIFLWKNLMQVSSLHNFIPFIAIVLMQSKIYFKTAPFKGDCERQFWAKDLQSHFRIQRLIFFFFFVECMRYPRPILQNDERGGVEWENSAMECNPPAKRNSLTSSKNLCFPTMRRQHEEWSLQRTRPHSSFDECQKE